MKWVRCSTCRTVNDIERYTTCDGCNAELSGQSVPYAAATPVVRTQTRRDGQWILIVLFVLGVLSAIVVYGAFHSSGDDIIGFLLAATPLIILFFLVAWIATLRKIERSRLSDTAKVLLQILSLEAAGLGGYIVLAVLCKGV